MEQTITAQQNENDDLRESIEMMNKTISKLDEALVNQALLNAEIQQAMKDMNASNTENIEKLFSLIVGIQLNISSSQTAISSLVEELENLNSSNSDLLANLNSTQIYLDSLESDLNTAIADLISDIDWANDTANWANNSLRLPYMDLEGAYFPPRAYLVGANFSYADLDHAQMHNVNLSSANLAYASLDDVHLFLSLIHI